MDRFNPFPSFYRPAPSLIKEIRAKPVDTSKHSHFIARLDNIPQLSSLEELPSSGSNRTPEDEIKAIISNYIQDRSSKLSRTQQLLDLEKFALNEYELADLDK